MLLGLEVEFRRRPHRAQLDIGLLVGPDRDVICRDIGDGSEQGAQLIVKPLLLTFALGDRDFERGDLVHQPLGGGFILACFRLANLLGSSVAAGLRLLQFLNCAAALLVQLENLIQRLLGRLEGAVLQPRNEGVLVVANPFDVEQGLRP